MREVWRWNPPDADGRLGPEPPCVARARLPSTGMAYPPWHPTKTRGQPSPIDKPVTVRADGSTVTTADRIIQSIRSGNYIEQAAAAAGVDKETLHGWQRTGAKVSRSMLTGKTSPDDHTEHELRCVEFSAGVYQAEAEALAEDVALSAKLARGGYERKVTTTKTEGAGQDAKVTTTIKTETAEPDGEMLRWRLQHRHPKLFGRQLVEVSGPDGGPIELSVEERRTALLATLDVIAGRLAEGTDWDDEAAGMDALPPPVPELPPIPEL